MLPNSKYMIYRVTSPVRLTQIAQAVGAELLEACRIPGKTRSSFRAWTADGQCFEMWASGDQAFVPVPRPQFNRVVQ